MSEPQPVGGVSERDIVITRVFNAPRELVWKAWTDPAHVEKWFGPEGFTTRVSELDFRVGGRSLYVMVGPDGTEYPCQGVFLEIVPLKKIVTTDEFGEDYEAPASVDLPSGMVLTTLFEDLGPQTKLTLIIAHPTLEDRRKHEEMGVVGGWQSSFTCLDAHLATLAVAADREIVITRTFDAPRELVFDAWTDTSHISHWWGPVGFTTTTHESDPRPGGIWRFTMHGPDGVDYPNCITWEEFVRPERLTYRHTGEGETADTRFHTTVTLVDNAGRTELTLRMVFDSPEERQTVVDKFGAIEGGQQTLQRLAEHLARQPA